MRLACILWVLLGSICATFATFAQSPVVSIAPAFSTKSTNGYGLVIGASAADPATIGAGSMMLNLSTSQPNTMEGTRHLRLNFGGYDNYQTGGSADDDGGEATALIWTHHSSILGASTHSVVLNGSNHDLEGHYSAAIGGTQGDLRGDYGAMLPGLRLQIASDFALARGKDGIVSADFGEVRGEGGNARLAYGATQAAGSFSATGDAQATDLVRRVETSTCDPTPMPTLEMPTFTVWAFDIMIAARRVDVNSGGAYQIKGAIRKNASNGSTEFIGVPLVTVLGEDDERYDVRPVANRSVGGLQIVVTCAGRWVASYRLTEVSGLN